jgi:uncharacterized membrane protein YhaH (DUF805 family)
MLFEFSGREDRSSFWPYAAAVFGISMVLSMLAIVPLMFATMRSMQEYAEAHPENVTVTQGPGHYSMQVHGGDFAPDFGPMFWMMGLVFLAAVVLYAAAVVRRLHDTGRSGWWGLMPLPFIAFSMIAMPQIFASAGTGSEPDLSLFFAVFFSNMLYIVTLIILVVLLAIKSTEGPNRFGDNR